MIAIHNGRGIRGAASLPFKASPNVGGKLVPEYIVLHDTASGLNDLSPINWLTDKASKVSAHVVIGRDGKITQLVPFNIKARHAGQSIWQGRPLLNGFSIGIEIVNPGRLQKVGEGVYKGVGSYDTNKDRSLVIERRKTAAHGDGYWLAYGLRQPAGREESDGHDSNSRAQPDSSTHPGDGLVTTFRTLRLLSVFRKLPDVAS